MAEQDNAAKTEKPTPKRLEQARERGQVATSQDVKSWGMLIAGLFAVGLLAPPAAYRLASTGARMLSRADTISVDAESLQPALAGLIVEVARTIAPALAALVLAAVAASVIQTGLIWAPTRIAPQLSRISPASGAKRLMSARALVEFGKGVLKLAAVASVCVLIARALLADVALLPAVSLPALVERVQAVAVWLTAGTLVVLTLIAGLDFAFQRLAFLKQMRMSRQEVRDEVKQAEGDPHIKARIRRLRSERARHRMMAAVPEAAVVITNPSHYAIALAYDMAAMAAPKVVAKGVDSLAQRIRAVAEANEVPVVENPPLARALYAAVDLDEEIPVEHYQAVAQVIGYVMRLKDRLS
jgi:flagellar biosynthetic protein FlhB